MSPLMPPLNTLVDRREIAIVPYDIGLIKISQHSSLVHCKSISKAFTSVCSETAVAPDTVTNMYRDRDRGRVRQGRRVTVS